MRSGQCPERKQRLQRGDAAAGDDDPQPIGVSEVMPRTVSNAVRTAIPRRHPARQTRASTAPARPGRCGTVISMSAPEPEWNRPPLGSTEIAPQRLDKREYEKELERLQVELARPSPRTGSSTSD